MIKAFIFDLDGVITDTAAYHYQAWKALADELGVPFNLQDNEKLKGVSRRGSLEFIIARSDESFMEEDVQRLMKQKNEDYLERIANISPADILAGVEEAFEDLKSRGLKIGLASASKNAAFVVERLGMKEAFDYIADAAQIPNSKPAPDVFLDVAQAFSLSPGVCVGIEDAAAGVQAIKSAKMFAVGIGEEDVLAQADIIYKDMEAFNVAEIIERAG